MSRNLSLCMRTAIWVIIWPINLKRCLTNPELLNFSRWIYDWRLDHISYVTWFCWLFINLFYFHHERRLRVRIYSCQLFWSSFEISCFVKVKVHIIGIDRIWTSELRQHDKMKTIVDMNSDFNIFITRIWISMFILFPRYCKPLVVGRPWNVQ